MDFFQPDGFVGFPRLAFRFRAQLLLQDARAFFKLAHGRRLLASQGVQDHQPSVGRLVESIQREPFAPVFNGGPVGSTVGEVMNQVLEGLGQILA